MKYRCARCGKTADRPTGHVNRSRAAGMKLYCGRKCSGMAKRKGKTKAQRREEKRLYDINYRATSPTLKARKHEFHLRTYDPVKAAKVRKKRMPQHVEYCRQPWYKEWKRKYDQRYQARKYGAFAEAFQLTKALEKEIRRRSTDEERQAFKYQDSRTNKRQNRQREAGQAQRSNRHSSPDGR
jgi:hypothetical protein